MAWIKINTFLQCFKSILFHFSGLSILTVSKSFSDTTIRVWRVFENLAPTFGPKSFFKVETKECHFVENHSNLLTKQSWVKIYRVNQIQNKIGMKHVPF